MSYKQLVVGQRYQIEAYLREGFIFREIGNRLSVGGHWERGLNESFNGLLRQYIRKGTDLRTVSDRQISEIERALNAIPRKCLGFRQPVAVFNELRKAA